VRSGNAFCAAAALPWTLTCLAMYAWPCQQREVELQAGRDGPAPVSAPYGGCEAEAAKPPPATAKRPSAVLRKPAAAVLKKPAKSS